MASLLSTCFPRPRRGKTRCLFTPLYSNIFLPVSLLNSLMDIRLNSLLDIRLNSLLAIRLNSLLAIRVNIILLDNINIILLDNINNIRQLFYISIRVLSSANQHS